MCMWFLLLLFLLFWFSFRYFLSFSFIFFEDSKNGGFRTLRIKISDGNE